MTVWRMRIACRYLRLQNPHSEYVMLIVFLLNNSCSKAPDCFVIRTLSVFFTSYSLCSDQWKKRWPQESNTRIPLYPYILEPRQFPRTWPPRFFKEICTDIAFYESLCMMKGMLFCVSERPLSSFVAATACQVTGKHSDILFRPSALFYPLVTIFSSVTLCNSAFWLCAVYTNDMIYLLTAIGLSRGGSSTVNIYTQTIHRTTQSKQYIEQRKKFGRVRAVPRHCGFTLAFALQLTKKHEKPSVRLAEECQLARWMYIKYNKNT